MSCFDSINSILSVKASSFVSWSHPLFTNPFETFDKLTLFDRFDNGTPNMVDIKTNDVIPSNMTSPHRENNRLLKCDVIKMKFLKLWDLSGYSERAMSKRPTCQN